MYRIFTETRFCTEEMIVPISHLSSQKMGSTDGCNYGEGNKGIALVAPVTVLVLEEDSFSIRNTLRKTLTKLQF